MKREIDFMEVGKQMGGITIGLAAAQAIDGKLATSMPSLLVRGGIYAAGGFIGVPMLAPKNDLVKNIGIGLGVYGVRKLAEHFKFDKYINGIGAGSIQEYYQALPEMSGVEADRWLNGIESAVDADVLNGVEDEVTGIY